MSNQIKEIKEEGKGLPEPETTRVGVRNVVRVLWGVLRATATGCLCGLSVGE